MRLHTLLNLRGTIPTMILISEGKLGDVDVLDELILEPGAFYVMDHAYVDFNRLNRFRETGDFFVIRAKIDIEAERRYSRAVDRSTGLVSDQTVTLVGFYWRKGFPAPLRRVRLKDAESGRGLVFLSNNFELPALTVAKLYSMRWQVELFFKWNKQNLRVEEFFETSENAVETQV